MVQEIEISQRKIPDVFSKPSLSELTVTLFPFSCLV